MHSDSPQPEENPPLTPDLLLFAYRQAIFPMADPPGTDPPGTDPPGTDPPGTDPPGTDPPGIDPPDTGEIDWYSPDPRAILPLDSFHIPRNLARLIRKKPFRITSDTCFEQIMRRCATFRSSDNPTWISEELIRAYTGLFDLGHAHSIEAWLGDELVGGLYGVHIGAAFCGESMFSSPERGGTNASKICLVHLVNWLNHRGFTLLDTQFINPHLEQFGCTEIPRENYLQLLDDAISQTVEWGEFQQPTQE